MAHLDLIAALVDELDDVETELRLDNLRDFLRVGEVEGHIGEGRVENATAHIVHLATITGRAGVFAIETGQRLERRLALVHAVGIVAQLLFHAVDFGHVDARHLGDDLHLDGGGHVGDAVGRQVLEIAAHLGRRDGDVLDKMLTHALGDELIAEVVAHGGANLRHRLLAILLELLHGAYLLHHVLDVALYLTGHLGIGHLDTVELGLVEEQLLNGYLLGDGAVGVAAPAHTFHGRTDAFHFDLALQDGLVAHYPDHLVDDAADAIALLCMERER